MGSGKATKYMATKVKENEEAENEREGSHDGPLLDLSDDAVKKMIKAAKNAAMSRWTSSTRFFLRKR